MEGAVASVTLIRYTVAVVAPGWHREVVSGRDCVWGIKGGCSSASISAFYPLRCPHIHRSSHPPFTEGQYADPVLQFMWLQHRKLGNQYCTPIIIRLCGNEQHVR